MRGFHEHMHPFFGHGHGPHPLAWAIFAIVLAALIVSLLNLGLALARGRNKQWAWRMAPPFGGQPRNALELVRFRYARGEISREDYLQQAGDLGATPEAEAPPPS